MLYNSTDYHNSTDYLLSSVAITFESKPQLENVVVELALEPMFP